MEIFIGVYGAHSIYCLGLEMSLEFDITWCRYFSTLLGKQVVQSYFVSDVFFLVLLIYQL